MVIIEGPDGSGKTTLITQLKEELGIEVAPRVVDKDTNAMVNLADWVDNNLNIGRVPTLFDRHRLISETIYGPIMREKASENGFVDMSWLAPRMSRLYNEVKPFIIYCLPPLQVVRDNILGHEDNKAVEAKINQIYASYVARISLDYSISETPVKVWNYTASPQINGLPSWLMPSIIRTTSKQ